MNLRKLSSLFRLVTATARTNHLKNRIEPVALFRQSRNRRWRTSHITNVGGCILLSSGFLSLFKRDSDDENSPEQKLIMTIKRSILCIQKEEYDKAEQMLHLALRMAQDLQSKDGITYVYDLMANLALEREQFKKAEKLFVDVMKRLFADGFKEDDIKVLHISSKVAHIAQLEGQIDKALQGFNWTLLKLEEKLKQLPTDEEIRELWGLTKNWYGQTLMENQNYLEAKKHLLEAFAVFTEIHGKFNSEALTMLNNLSVACTYLDDITGARKFLDEALEIAKELPDAAETGMLKANLGLLYLKQGLLQQAKDACTFAWRFGKKMNHKDIVDQADNCLKLINEFNK